VTERRSPDSPPGARHVETLSPWVSLVTRTVVFPSDQSAQPFHSFALADYVNVLAVTADGRIPLVRQYRPAMEGFTLELPGGLREPGEEPMATAARELFEETGFAAESIEPVGSLRTDTGRLENRIWGFVARTGAAESAEWRAETGVERVFMTPAELRQAVIDGRFDHGLHVALIGLAVTRGLFDWTS
jgi:ADP-ribose pyrophosphatase